MAESASPNLLHQSSAGPTLLRRGMMVYLDPENIEGSTFMIADAGITNNFANLISGEQEITLTVTLGRAIPKQGGKA